MTKKWMLGIFLALFLLLPNLALAGEGSSPGPTITKIGAVPSDCGCLKKDLAPPSPRLRPHALVENPSLTVNNMGCTGQYCQLFCQHAYCHGYHGIWGPCYVCECMCWGPSNPSL
jgi:hypothetical protein